MDNNKKLSGGQPEVLGGEELHDWFGNAVSSKPIAMGQVGASAGEDDVDPNETYDIKFRDILYNDKQIGPYPTDKLKRVDKPTNKIVGEIQRRDQRDNIFGQAFRGEYGEKVKELAPMMSVTEPIGAALISVQRHINSIKPNDIAPKKAPIPQDPRVLSRHIKSLAHFLGADMVGICKLPQSAVYTTHLNGDPLDVDYKFAIVLLCRKTSHTAACSSGYDWIFDPVSFQTYQRLACQTEVMTNYIKRLGHDAAASNMWNYLTLMPQLVLEAGLGEVSRMGLIVNPFLGGHFKAAAVLTDLPLEPDKYIDFGLQDYCEKCSICAEQCPVGAITKGGKTVYNGYETWELDKRKCASFDILNTEGCVCGRCTKLCPWSLDKNDPRDFEDWDGTTEGLIRRVDEQAKKRRDAGFTSPLEKTDKWWFDLERRSLDDHTLVIPKTTQRL
ncbi:MAG: 4Fe-4S dicluster domain-containing protein [Clostridiales bacterium]|nr:4Fe-4S dicluster domain-containing protein [Clostridiales bacterium]